MKPIRSLPRLFLPGASCDGPIVLPSSEVDKFRKVLRLKDGDEIAVLPDDGTLIRCAFHNLVAEPILVESLTTEPKRIVTLIQALPKGDRLETVIRMGTELGVRRFVVFPAIRSVVHWEPRKVAAKLARYASIAREAAEQSFRARLPIVEWQPDFASAIHECPKAILLDESESESRSLSDSLQGTEFADAVQFVVGPEGGWDPKEKRLFEGRGATMGPLVLRTDTAGIAAAALALLNT